MASKFYSSPRWSGELLDCSMPMTFDQYSRCSYDCQYCFSFFQRAVKHLNPITNYGGTREHYLKERPEGVDPRRIRRMFTGEAKTMFSDYIERRVWMQWGGLSDPFDEFERSGGLGLELLRFFDEIQYPICFSTKGTWWTEDERYMSLFQKNKHIWNVKISIIGLDVPGYRLIERGCPTPVERLAAIRRLAERGVGVTLRLRPFIIGYSDRNNDHLTLIREAARAGATALSTEFFCMEGRMTAMARERYGRISEAIGFDLEDFYRRNTARRSGYMRLNPVIKAPYVDGMERACRRGRLRFYVSDAHHKGRSCNGSCCGLKPGENYHRGQFTEAIVIARRRGEVSWADIEGKILPGFRTLRAVEAVNFARSSPSLRARFHQWTVYDLIRYYWNTPKEAKSPYQYFGGALRPDRLDSGGNIVYKYVGYGNL